MEKQFKIISGKIIKNNGNLKNNQKTEYLKIHGMQEYMECKIHGMQNTWYAKYMECKNT